VATRVLVVDRDPATVNYLTYELKKAGFEAKSAGGGKEGLIVAWRDRPHIIVLDPVFTDMPVAEFIQKIRGDNRTANRPLVAFSSLRDPDQIQRAIDLGFNSYFAKEGDALPLLLKTLNEYGTQGVKEHHFSGPTVKPAVPEKEGRLVVFLSAKGGTGTSSLCANMAAMLGEMQQEAETVVVDLVLPLGSIAPVVGYDGPLNIVEAARMTLAEATEEYYRDALPTTGLWHFRLLAGCPDPEEANELDVARVPVILNTLKRSFDYVFVDLGRSLSRISLPIILAANQVVVILSVDQATVELTRKVMRYLEGKGLDREQLFPLINRAVGLEGLTRVQIEAELGLSIPGSFPFISGNFALANNLHVPIYSKFPGEVAAISMREITTEVVKQLEKRSTGPIPVSRG
jgi:MinD-like ATPase involved in chromosome partitioning or flagellar assembly/CheY-like chemotaxis protein